MSVGPKTPEDWDDHEGWDRYYSAFHPHGDLSDAPTGYGSFGVGLGDFIDRLQACGWRTLWFPGCGMSPLPKLLSRFGFSVHATDVSKAAIDFQRSARNTADNVEMTCKTKRSSGELQCTVHDFREPYLRERFDAVFNVRAFQALQPTSMRKAARSHHAALKPRGVAYFDTLNVQGKQRDGLEQALVDAGFYVPLHELDRWYRSSLDATGVPYAFMLHTPTLAAEYTYTGERRERDWDRLLEIYQEYRSRRQTEYEREQQRLHEKVKTAVVIYSTG